MKVRQTYSGIISASYEMLIFVWTLMYPHLTSLQQIRILQRDDNAMILDRMNLNSLKD